MMRLQKYGIFDRGKRCRHLPGMRVTSTRCSKSTAGSRHSIVLIFSVRPIDSSQTAMHSLQAPTTLPAVCSTCARTASSTFTPTTISFAESPQSHFLVQDDSCLRVTKITMSTCGMYLRVNELAFWLVMRIESVASA